MRAEQLDLRLTDGGALAVVIDSNAERVQPVRVDLRQGALTTLPPLPEAGFGIEAACITEPGDLEGAIKTALTANRPYLLEVQTRGDVPMPRTGYWDIADFLRLGND